ncbi:hypothetical protein LTR36_005220 [Oleoguttula mirabilis]|uniref:Uncharacterized protein n=1 Tax=Oleoguttula mirabilis TaxID=1507867 RepID=A0AAV9JWK3_9PEZI|nr:hypothetical protein LTR36_005220 [Oleoguttula mirabilis]
MIEAHCAFQCKQRNGHERLRLEQSLIRPVYKGLSLLSALQLYLNWNGGMPSAWKYWSHATELAADYLKDNGLTLQDDRPLTQKYKQYYGRVIEALLCLNMELERHRNNESDDAADYASTTWIATVCAHVVIGDNTVVHLMVHMTNYHMPGPDIAELTEQDWEAMLEELKYSPLKGRALTEADKDELEDGFWAAISCKYEPNFNNCSSDR